jgi:protein-S-isoprenylcysteine O-methyltransferase Ste14
MPDEKTMIETASETIVTCWGIFLCVWAANAARAKPTVEKQSVESRMAHRIPIGLGTWLLFFPKFSAGFNRQIIPATDELQMAAMAICICGLVFTIWARYTLAGNWSSDVTFKREHELIRSGPYRFVRHPIYTGLLAMCLGTAIHVGQLRCLLSLVFVSLGFWIKLRQEERLLLRHFPDAYPNYRRDVKALVPFVI